MATESAVTPAGCHPYAVGPEQCMVHNGSFANHATIRRELRSAGVDFDSENDTEVGARFIAKQLADGRDVESALKELCATFDGFYTLLVSNRDSFAVVRDAIACKPAVIAETADWVAMGSEYRALAGLPGVESAAIWEPEPEVIYAWTHIDATVTSSTSEPHAAARGQHRPARAGPVRRIRHQPIPTARTTSRSG